MLPIGATVDASIVFSEIDRVLAEYGLTMRRVLYLAGTSTPRDRAAAEAWVAEGAKDGFTRVRYVVPLDVAHASTIIVDLAAIAPLAG